MLAWPRWDIIVVPPVWLTEIVVPLPAWSVLDRLMKKQRLSLIQAMSFLVECVLGSKALLLVMVNSLTVRAAFNTSMSRVPREPVSSKPSILSNMVLVSVSRLGLRWAGA